MDRTHSGVSGYSWATIGGLAALLGYIWFQSVALPSPVLRGLTNHERIERLSALTSTEVHSGNEPTVEAWNRISTDPPESRRRWVILATGVSICCLMALLASHELSRLVAVFVMAVNGAVFGFLALLMRASAPGTIYWTIKPQWQNLPFGAFVNRNHAGLFLAISGLCALFGICLLLSQRVTRWSNPEQDWNSSSPDHSVNLTGLRMIWLSQKDSVLFFLAACALFCAVSSIVAASRSGALAFGAVILIATLMLWICGADRRLTYMIASFGGIAALVSGAKFDFLIKRFEQASLESGWTSRYTHWSDVLQHSHEFALTGVGHGSYAYATLPYISNPSTVWFKNADNQFVEMFVELGVVGCLIVGVAIAAFAARCAILIRNQETQSKIVGLFGLGILATCTINASGDFALTMPGVILPVALCAGLVLGYRPAVPVRTPGGLHGVGISVTKYAVLLVLAWASAVGVAHLANGTNVTQPNLDLTQRIARPTSNFIDEPSLLAIQNDAMKSVNEFISPARAAILALSPDEPVDDATYSLEGLAILQRALKDNEDDEDLRSLRERLSETESLVHARDQYLKLIELSPMRFENHVSVARLELFLCPGASVSQRIDKARSINPSSCIDSGKMGIVSIVNGDLEVGGSLLGQSLRHQKTLEKDIFAVIKSQLSIQQITKFVLRNDAPLLILAADRYYADPSEWLQRNFLYAQLRQAIENGSTEGLEDREIKYYLAKAKRISGDHQSAFVDFESACADWDAPVTWHTELASYYEQEGRLKEAKSLLLKMQTTFGFEAGRERQIERLEKKLRSVLPRNLEIREKAISK